MKDIDDNWSTEEWKKFFVEWEEQQYHQGNLEYIDKYYSPELVDHHLPPGYPEGNEGKRRLVRELLEAFPEFRITNQDLVVERVDGGQKVVERFTIEGTHQGNYRGIAATGKRFKVDGISICRFAGGKEVEHWAVINELDMLEQLGVLSSPFRD